MVDETTSSGGVRGPSLLDLPYETIFAIAEVGELDVPSRISLTQTCKHLFRMAEEHAYWISAARVLVRQGLTPPLPPFHASLEALSAKQLMLSCIRCHSINANLQSDSPKYRKHHIIQFPNESGPVENFAFLQGGRFVMSTHTYGAIHIWDLVRSPEDWSPLTVPIASRIIPDRLILAIGLQSSDYEATSATVAILCYDDFSLDLSFYIFRLIFTFTEKDLVAATFTESYAMEDIHAYPTSSVIAQDGLAVAVVLMKPAHQVCLVVMDYSTRGQLTVVTGLDETKRWDVVLSGSDILLLCEMAGTVEYAAYWKVREMLPPNGSIRIERAPDIVRSRPYDFPRPLLTGAWDWFSVHPWDTPNWQTGHYIPVLLEASRQGTTIQSERHWNSAIGMHWVLPAQVLRSLKNNEALPNDCRRLKLVENHCSASSIDQSTMLIPSTYGRRLLWINMADADAEPRLDTFVLQTPWDDTVDETKPSTQLDIPLDLRLAHRIDFDDEYGQLLLTVNTNEEDREQVIHIFVY